MQVTKKYIYFYAQIEQVFHLSVFIMPIRGLNRPILGFGHTEFNVSSAGITFELYFFKQESEQEYEKSKPMKQIIIIISSHVLLFVFLFLLSFMKIHILHHRPLITKYAVQKAISYCSISCM